MEKKGPRPVRKPVIKGPAPKTTVVRRPASAKPAAPKAQKPVSKPEESKPTMPPVNQEVVTEDAPVQAAQPKEEPVLKKTSPEPVSQIPIEKTVPEKKESTKSQRSSKPEKKIKPPKEKKGDSMKVIMGIFLLLLSGATAFLVYERINGAKELAATKEEAQTNAASYKNELERKIAEINHLEDSIQVVISEKERLGEELSQERAKIEELEALKGQLKSKQVSINSLNRKLKNFKKQAQTAKASLGNLVAENQRLASEKAQIEMAMKAKEDSLSTVAESHAKMAAKLAKAAALKADNIEIAVYNSGGKLLKHAKSYRSMFVGNIKATLVLAKNEFADPGKKVIYMRMMEPSGAPLFSGNKSFKLNGRKTFYTEKQTIDFNNTNQRISFFYTKGSRYIPGKYTLEFFDEDGNKVGDTQLTVSR